MKLVEILARDLEEWPGGWVSASQDNDRCVNGYAEITQKYIKKQDSWDADSYIPFSRKPFGSVSEDYKTAIVTREMWQAERDKLKPKKANADGWVRHRGGKCPVEDGAIVEVRLRDGKEWTGEEAEKGGFWVWRHTGDYGDIMAYRIHKPTEQPEPDSYVSVDEAMAYIDSYHTFVGDVPLKDAITVNIRDQHQENPLAWRDRIREIDRTVEALEEERVSLIQRLEDEGFKLIDQVNSKIAEAAQANDGMSDWRNWEAGDLVTVWLDNDCEGLDVGRVVKVRSIEQSGYDGSMAVSVFYDGDWNFPEASDGSGRCVFKFHSRPSA